MKHGHFHVRLQTVGKWRACYCSVLYCVSDYPEQHTEKPHRDAEINATHPIIIASFAVRKTSRWLVIQHLIMKETVLSVLYWKKKYKVEYLVRFSSLFNKLFSQSVCLSGGLLCIIHPRSNWAETFHCGGVLQSGEGHWPLKCLKVSVI